MARPEGYWTAERRREAESSGAAMPGGRFPIEDCADVQAAVHDLNRVPARQRQNVRRHIVRRATALGCPLPDTWRVR